MFLEGTMDSIIIIKLSITGVTVTSQAHVAIMLLLLANVVN